MNRLQLFSILIALFMSGLHAEEHDALSLDANSTSVLPREEVSEKIKVDTITVKGSVLQGQVVELNADHLRFRLIYGKGSIQIDHEDIEQLQTEHEYDIYYRGRQSVGKIVDIKESTWLLIRHGDTEETIKIEDIDRFMLSTKENGSITNKIHHLFPYSQGNMGIGMEFESGTNVKRKLKLSAHLERKESQHRTIFDTVYSYEETGTVETAIVKNKDEWVTSLEQDYYFQQDTFLFGQVGYDYDDPRGISSRIYPAFGIGERFEKERESWIELKIGGGAVFERFVSYGRQEYLAAYVGMKGRYTTRELYIVDRLIFDADVFYMPSIKDISEHWLARYRASVTLPITEALALRFVMRQVNDDNPSPEVGNNKFTMDLMLSLVY